jgi:hypothetical protein
MGFAMDRMKSGKVEVLVGETLDDADRAMGKNIHLWTLIFAGDGCCQTSPAADACTHA